MGGAARAWYAASVEEFVGERASAVLGEIVSRCGYDIVADQNDAWRVEIEMLQGQLRGLAGSILFEFSIPRMGRRVDVVLLVGAVVFVVEFKVRSATFDRAAIDQVWDYALDLKNFHEASHHLPIVPILVATEAEHAEIEVRRDPDDVYQPIRVAPSQLREVLDRLVREIEGPPVDAERWLASRYRPTPTIVEAARALYAQHSVESIARHDAGAQNLAVTSRHIEELVDEAKRKRQKVICFVTGVPGAGKTLVGLNVATQHREEESTDPAVYLSGNGPLVDVLREALARDEVARKKELGVSVTKSKVKESVKAFIQNVHHFRDEGLSDRVNAPAEHVAIFDEAQRAWTREKARDVDADEEAGSRLRALGAGVPDPDDGSPRRLGGRGLSRRWRTGDQRRRGGDRCVAAGDHLRVSRLADAHLLASDRQRVRRGTRARSRPLAAGDGVR